jgi:tellurite resistance protein
VDHWNVKGEEKAMLAAKQGRIDQLQRASSLAEAVLRLRNQSGFQEFLKVIEDLHKAALNHMDGCRTTEALWELKGQIKALKNILNVMRDTENAHQTLAGQLRVAQY